MTENYAGEAYRAASEMQTYYFLIESAFNIRECLGDMTSYSLYAAIQRHLLSYTLICFFSGKLWPFPLIARVFEGGQATRYNYNPKSDFSFSLCDIPIIILAVCSDKHADKLSESDRPRLLIQAACLVRLWNHLLGERGMVIMAVYVDKDFIASRYLLFQEKSSNAAQVRRSFIESVLYSHPSAG